MLIKKYGIGGSRADQQKAALAKLALQRRRAAPAHAPQPAQPAAEESPGEPSGAE